MPTPMRGRASRARSAVARRLRRAARAMRRRLRWATYPIDRRLRRWRLRRSQHRFERLRAQGDLPAAARELESQLPLLGRGRRRRARVNLFYLHQQMGDHARATHFLTKASGRGTKPAEKSYALMRQGEHDRALAIFRRVCDDVAGEAAAPYWVDGLRMVHGLEPRLPAGGPGEEGGVPDGRPPLGKITVSGMGWSGSGALYDFLREFSSVHAHVGESRLIEGRYGLKGLLDTPRDERGDYLPRLFKLGLLGISRCESYNDYRHARYSRAFVAGPGSLSYASHVHWLLWQLTQEELADEEIPAVFNRFLDGALRSLQTDERRFLLLDNVVHISSLAIARHIDQLTVLATVRDPRSQYPDLVAKNPRFHCDVERFIKDYRRQRRRLDEALAIEGVASRTIVVQFEEFVCDASLREHIATRIGMDPDAWVGQRYLVPARSQRNVDLFSTFEDQRAIARISSELGEYCVV